MKIKISRISEHYGQKLYRRGPDPFGRSGGPAATSCAADRVSRLSCVDDVGQLAFPSLLVLSQWLSRSIGASPTEVVLDS